MKVDIMVNKTSELYHANMILQYAMIDSNFLKICHFLKAWNNDLVGGKQPWKFEDYQRKGGAAGAGKSTSWGWGGGDEWAGKAYGKSRIGPYGKE